jgi:hypothetical protein
MITPSIQSYALTRTPYEASPAAPSNGRSRRGHDGAEALALKKTEEYKRQPRIRFFFAGIAGAVGLASVFTSMKLKRKHPRVPRSLGSGKPPALAPRVSHTNSTTSIEHARECTTAPDATRRVLWYFEDRGGFWRVGQLIASQMVKRGQQKGRTLLEIQCALNRRLTRYSDEVKWE